MLDNVVESGPSSSSVHDREADGKDLIPDADPDRAGRSEELGCV